MKNLHIIASLALSLIAQSAHAALAPTQSLSNKTAWSLSYCLNDTIGAVASARATIEKVKKLSTTDTSDDDIATVRKKIDDACTESPIALMMECDTADCQLNRAKKFGYRALYEELVVQALCQKIEEKKQVVYTSFGSGGMFQDFVILAKALLKKPDATITIHLIDKTYWALAACLKALTQSTKITDNSLDIAPILPNLTKRLSPETSIDEAKGRLYAYFMTAEIRALQFTTTLKKLFPKASLEIFIHESAEDYILRSAQTQSAHADILTAADINDNESLKSEGPQQYYALCSRTSKFKKDLIGIYLARSDFSIARVYVLKNKDA